VNQVSQQINAGQTPTTTVRTLLSWFGAYRRTWRQVKKVRDALNEVELLTVPDFEGEYIDSSIGFQRKGKPQVPPKGTVKQEQEATTTVEFTSVATAELVTNASAEPVDPTHRIGRLMAAHTVPIRIAPDASVSQAVTIMLTHDFSQLPVMTTDREVKGLFSWKSLGHRAALGKECTVVRECMDPFQEIGSDASIFEAIPIIAQYECVLVRDSTRKVVGIITPSDISLQFWQLAEPFLLIGTIENHIRNLLAANFSAEDLQAAKDPGDTERNIEDASDLSFGEYIRLLQDPVNWRKLQTTIDRGVFVEELTKICDIRNDVMHFDPDWDVQGIVPLRVFAQFLDLLRRLESE
jgi:predicted transcriptional regulator